MKAVAYCRVSTGKQKDDCTIEIQKEAIYKHCEKNKRILIRIFEDDGLSGAMDIEERPGLAEMFEFLKNKVNIREVIIFSLDRLARDLRIQENIIYDLHDNMNRKLISIMEPDLGSDDPSRVLFRQIRGSFSQYEKSMITMRLKLGRLRKSRKGGYAGGSKPLGYAVKDNELIIDEKDSMAIKLIFGLRRKRKSLHYIARELNSLNVPTARGGKWYARTVKYVLENRIYKGKISYNNVVKDRQDLRLI